MLGRRRMARLGGWLVAAAGTLGMACAAGGEGGGGEEAGRVVWVGAMREAMHGEGRGVVRLMDARREHLYAIGPVEGLRGEVTVWDGRASIARVGEDEQGEARVEVTEEYDVGAAFLVYANVERWREVEAPEGVRTLEELEAFVARAGAEHGAEPPFPFLVRGRAERVEYHVMHKTEPGRMSPEAHARAKVTFEAERTPVRLVGFFSDAHHGVFTHHGTDVHVHVILGEDGPSGHLDAVVLEPGATLMLPAGAEEHGRGATRSSRGTR